MPQKVGLIGISWISTIGNAREIRSELELEILRPEKTGHEYLC
jgi:hypothetical protein